MKDKRPVDELSVEELERILFLKKRETRMQRFVKADRRVDVPLPPALPVENLPTNPPQFIEARVPTPAASVYNEFEPPANFAEGDPQFEDELEPLEPHRRYMENPPQRSKTMTQIFFLVEAAAILGLIGILFLGYRGLQTIDQNIEMTDNISATSEAELLSRLVQPTATPIISINAVVLPGGHIWNENGQHSFNFSEVPAPYRASFQEQLSAPNSLQTVFNLPGAPRRIQIPAIGVDASIRSGDDWISLQAGVGHNAYSGLPGQKGNMVLTAHNDIYGEIFRDLQDLEAGDEIRIQTDNGQWYTYAVDTKQVVEPSEVWVLGQDLGGETPLATLITCHPYRVDTHRMIVFAKLIN